MTVRTLHERVRGVYERQTGFGLKSHLFGATSSPELASTNAAGELLFQELTLTLTHASNKAAGELLFQEGLDQREKERQEKKAVAKAENQRGACAAQMKQASIQSQRAAAVKSAEVALAENKQMQAAATNRLAQQKKKDAEQARQWSAFQRVKARKDAAEAKAAAAQTFVDEATKATKATKAAKAAKDAAELAKQAEADRVWQEELCASMANAVLETTESDAPSSPAGGGRGGRGGRAGRGGRCGRGGKASAPAREQPPTEVEVTQENQCILCWSDVKTHLCVPCGHVCWCATCVAIAETPSKCPVCRADVAQVIRMYQ